MSLSIRNPSSSDWRSIRALLADDRTRVFPRDNALPEQPLRDDATGLIAERRGRIVGVCLVSAGDKQASCLGLAVDRDEDVERVAGELIAELQPWFIVKGIEPLKPRSILLDVT